MIEINDLECYPELKQYILICQYDNSEIRVTDEMLKNRFSDSEIARIKSGRSQLWLLIEIM